MKCALQSLESVEKVNGWNKDSVVGRHCTQSAHFLRQAIAEAEKTIYVDSSRFPKDQLDHKPGMVITAPVQAIAEAEKQEPVAWQPIATAPTGTEVFIGAYIDGEWKFGRSELFYEQANEFAGETFSGWFWAVDDCDNSVAEEPTHWMPLPEPPHTAPVHASDISQERVDETAKSEHELVGACVTCGAPHGFWLSAPPTDFISPSVVKAISKREWVGLEEEEILKCFDSVSLGQVEGDCVIDKHVNIFNAIRAIEAKLKEKNT
jgi:hypothetical protein